MLTKNELSELIDLSKDVAEARIKDSGMISRVVSINGEQEIITLDLRNDRVNLNIVDNKVKSFDIF